MLGESFKTLLPNLESDEFDANQAEDKKQIMAKEKNLMTMSLFALSMIAPNQLKVVKALKRTDWPEKLACKLDLPPLVPFLDTLNLRSSENSY